MAEDSLKQKTAKGLLWNTIHTFSMNGIQFLLMLFMARLLSPEDYGTIGLLAIFLSVSTAFIECGFTYALIRKQDRTQKDLSTVFYFNVIMSLFCYLLVFLIAPFVADFYEKPILCNVLRILGLTLPISSLIGTTRTILNFTMQFKKQAIISVTETFISGIIGLMLAIMGYGVWALVWQSLSLSIIGVFLYFGLHPWRPTLEFSFQSLKEMFGYSSKLLVTRLIDSIYTNIYPIVIGKVYSPTVLGHYSRAQHWAATLSTNFVITLQNVTFASLAKIQDDDERLREVYRKMIRTSVFIIFPLMIGLSAVAKPLIIFTIGEKWSLCSNILEVICVMYALSPIHALNINLLQVKGRSDLSLKLSVVGKIMSVIVLLVSIPFGIMTMCYCGIFSSIIMLFINTHYTGKILGLGFTKQMVDLFPSILLVSFMYLCVRTIMLLFDAYLIQLLFAVIVGVIAYVLPAYFLRMQEYKSAKDILVAMMKK